MKILPLIVILFFFYWNSSHAQNLTYKVNEQEISLPIKENFKFSQYFKANEQEYFSYLEGYYIKVISLKDYQLIDSTYIKLSASDINKYGHLISYCFNGLDSLYILREEAVFLYEHQKINTIIPINDLDPKTYDKCVFSGGDRFPIYYDAKKNEIIGQVYCSDNPESNKRNYKQSIMGSINMETHTFSTYPVTYPQMFTDGYYGFSDIVYGSSYKEFTFLTFAASEYAYIYNRYTNQLDSFPAKSNDQTEKMPCLDTTLSHNTEEKMKHFILDPCYMEFFYDPQHALYYRFFMPGLPLKKPNGKYSKFQDKRSVLIVFNAKFEKIGEYEDPIGYNSFVGDKGLYIGHYKSIPSFPNPQKFKILTFTK